MFRTAISLTLVLTQAVLAAPLYICWSAGGTVRLDSGPAACVGCANKRQHDHGGCCPGKHDERTAEGARGTAPCDCRHEPLCGVGQHVRRLEIVPAGDLLIAHVDQIAARHPGTSVFGVLQFAAADAAHTPLADQASVRLRC